MPKLLSVTYPSPQQAADRIVPLGWCAPCISEAKLAEAGGEPPVAVSAAVTMTLSVQQVPVPGQGTGTVVVPMPTCWRHISVTRSSGLLAAGAGQVPPGLNGSA